MLCEPYLLIDRANFEEVNYIKTPLHIKPEWYFLFVYCILRSVSRKLGGVVLMIMAILGLIFLTMGCMGGKVRKVSMFYWKFVVVNFGVRFVMLTLLGGEVVEYPYEFLGWLFTVDYFLRIVVMVGMSVLGVCVV